MSDNPLIYRVSQSAEEGFETSQEEYEAMREYAQNMLASTDPNDIMDTLCMMANACEFRALESGDNPPVSRWWYNAAAVARLGLHLLNGPLAKPNAKLENPALYFPDVEIMQ